MNIKSLDIAIFTSVNNLPHCSFFDSIFFLIDLLVHTGFIFFLVIILNYLSSSKKRKIYSVLSVISVLFSGIVVNLVLKNTFARARPFTSLDNVYIIKRHPDSYSFPSGHTSTIFALALQNLLIIPKRFDSFLIYALAFLTGFLRIYSGHHYPTDVIIGAFIGTLISSITYFSYKKLRNIKNNDDI